MDRMILKGELASLIEHTYFFKFVMLLYPLIVLPVYYCCVDSFSDG